MEQIEASGKNVSIIKEKEMGMILGDDNNYYKFNLSSVIPVRKRKEARVGWRVDFKIKNSEIDGEIEFEGFNERKLFSLILFYVLFLSSSFIAGLFEDYWISYVVLFISILLTEIVGDYLSPNQFGNMVSKFTNLALSILPIFFYFNNLLIEYRILIILFFCVAILWIFFYSAIKSEVESMIESDDDYNSRTITTNE